MKKAYESLKKEKADLPLIEIKPTHLYVRFLIQDSCSVNKLFEDSTLELFDYPLNYEILQDGTFYHDPNINNEFATYQYTVIPVTQAIPSLDYELLEYCFIPDESDPQNLIKGKEYIDFLAELEHTAYKITHNINNLKGWTSKTPTGYMKVYNTTKKEVGINGVKIRGHNFVKIAYGWTNALGKYTLNKSFRTNIRYSIVFENQKGFKIFGNFILTTAKHNMGFYSNSGHSTTLYQNSNSWKFATVNNASRSYYDNAPGHGVSAPPSNLRIWTFEKNTNSMSGAAPMLYRTWGYIGFAPESKIMKFFSAFINIPASLISFIKPLMPDVVFNINTQSDRVNSKTVYRLVYHELSHASHWTKVRNNYWAKYINYIITYGNMNNPYGDGTGLNAGYCGVGEMWANYSSAYFTRSFYSMESSFPYSSTWDKSFDSSSIALLDEDEDWYNPGFLRLVDYSTDLSPRIFFECLNSTNITDYVTSLKNKTTYDEQIDIEYAKFSDWQ